MDARPQPSGNAGAHQMTLWMLTLAVMPATGLALAQHLIPKGAVELMVAVSSAASHGVLLALLQNRREGDTPRLLAGSALTFLALVAGGILLPSVVPGLTLWSSAASWAAGGILMLCLRAMARGLPEVGDPGGSLNVKIVGALMGLVVLTAGFWLVSGMPQLIGRDLPGMAALGTSAVLALVPLTAAGPARRAVARLRRHPLSPLSRSLSLLVPIGIAATLLVAGSLPDPGFLSPGSAALIWLSATALALLLLGTTAQTDMAAALLLTGATPFLVGALSQGGLAPGGMMTVLLLGAMSALFLREKERSTTEQRAAGLPQPRVLVALQDRLNVLVLRVNFDSRSVHFPFGGGENFGGGYTLPLADFLRLAEMKVALELMQRLQRGEAPLDFPMRLRLRAPGVPGEARQEWVRQLFSVRVLENRYPQCWMVLVRQTQEADIQRERAEQSEMLLFSALAREERLRIAVARDLRAPVSALQNEYEALQEGGPWSESARSVALSLQLLSDSLDQLRSGAGTAVGLTGTGPFQIGQVLGWLSDTYASQAKYAGVTLHMPPSQQGDAQLHGDHGRVFLSLCRLVDNALTHARATEITVSGFLTRGRGHEATVTWLVRDNGVGIDQLRQASLFEPQGLIAAGGSAEARLGLFAVRKTMRQMGGDIILEEQTPDQEGCCFLLSHPALIMTQSVEVDSSGEPVLMPLRRALLLEDDEVAAEVLSARLRRLFGRVDVIADREALLARLKIERPDLLLIGRGTGSIAHADLVRAVRREDRSLPVVGIVPAVLPELRDAFEGAGATRVLVKPVGLAQLRDLVIDLYASGASLPAHDAVFVEDEEEVETFLADFQKVIGES